MNADAIERCPFCGSQPEAQDVSDYFVACPSCGVEGPAGAEDSQASAIAAWNRRAQPAAQAGPVTFGQAVQSSLTRSELRRAQVEPVAWMIDWPGEPDLGHYFSDGPVKPETGRSVPLYRAVPSNPAAQGVGADLEAVAKFLDGAAPLDGLWFGEHPMDGRPKFWWRKHLRAAIAQAQKEQQ